MKNNTISIELPKQIVVDDYHELDYIKDLLSELSGVKLKVKESDMFGGQYTGIISMEEDST